MHLTTIPMEELVKILALQLENGGRARLVVTGNSMYPMLRHRRDAVWLVPMTRQPQKRDLILYQRESGQYVLHRIVTRVRNGEFCCSGDNQWELEPMTSGQIIALVDGFQRNGKAYTGKEMSYRLYVFLWVALMPVRRPLLALRRRIGRLRTKLRKK